MTDGYMEQLATRNKRRYEDLLRSYEASRTLYRVAENKPGTPTPTDLESVRRQVDEAALSREAKLRDYRLELMKRG